MQKSLLITIIVVAGLTTLLGCASSSNTEAGANVKAYTTNLGTATLYDINQKTSLILDRYQFQIIRFESSTDMTYYETEWKSRYPFEDEIDQGVQQARTRIIIQATPRARGALGADLSTVRLQVENQVRYRDGVEWHYAAVAGMLKSYIKELIDNLTTEFRTGIRKF